MITIFATEDQDEAKILMQAQAMHSVLDDFTTKLGKLNKHEEQIDPDAKELIMNLFWEIMNEYGVELYI